MSARDLVKVTGPEAASYLQGQLSQDVEALAAGAVAPSFLLEPTGKVCAWLQVRRDGDQAYTLAVDAGHGEAVVQRLTRFKLRTKVAIEAAGAPGDPLADDGRAEDERIAAGVPRMGAELVPGQTIPAEAGQRVIDESVSFTKGCYTGQELVARIDSRGGNVPRHLRLIEIAGGEDEVPPTGADIEVDGSVVGHLTSAAWSPSRQAIVGLGYVARAVEPPVAAVVGEVAAQVRRLPE